MTERITSDFDAGKTWNLIEKAKPYSQVYRRLREYETAEEEGRLVVLPCKVGDMLYKSTRNFVSEFKVRFIEVSSCNCLILHTSVVKGINDSGEIFKEDDIGKTVFLTKEEAEKALKENEENADRRALD